MTSPPEILKQFGATDEILPELLAYTENPFDAAEIPALPLSDEPSVNAWRGYAQADDLIDALCNALVELNFPIEVGLSQGEAYQAARKKGVFPTDRHVPLTHPADLSLVIHPTPAGHIPVITTPHRDDFERLLQIFVYHNEPEPIPASMGAMIIGGYNNWGRIYAHKAVWQAANPPEATTPLHWQLERKRFLQDKSNYQDRFILLSSGFYSGVQAGQLGLDTETWRELSVKIRRDHECAHYFTRRVFGSMKNNLLDELIADYAGLVAATDEFEALWFLTFMGLEDYPDYRAGGRFENYTRNLSDAAKAVLQAIVVQAAQNLEQIDRQYRTGRDWTQIVIALTHLRLEELAATKKPETFELFLKSVSG